MYIYYSLLYTCSIYFTNSTTTPTTTTDTAGTLPDLLSHLHYPGCHQEGRGSQGSAAGAERRLGAPGTGSREEGVVALQQGAL